MPVGVAMRTSAQRGAEGSTRNAATAVAEINTSARMRSEIL